MSALTPQGSTSRWRRIVAYVLEHKGRRCLMRRDGRTCHAYATTVQHIIPRRRGGTDRLSNLIPACEPCNYGERDADDQPPAPPVSLSMRAAALVDALDAAGLPVTAGARTAAAALERAGVNLRCSRTALQSACDYRRARGPLTRM